MKLKWQIFAKDFERFKKSYATFDLFPFAQQMNNVTFFTFAKISITYFFVSNSNINHPLIWHTICITYFKCLKFICISSLLERIMPYAKAVVLYSNNAQQQVIVPNDLNLRLCHHPATFGNVQLNYLQSMPKPCWLTVYKNYSMS